MVLGVTLTVNLPVGLLTGFSQGLKVQVAVIVVSEDRLAAVATIHHVVNFPRAIELSTFPPLAMVQPGTRSRA